MNKATGNIVSNHENEQNTNEDISFLLSFFFFLFFISTLIFPKMLIQTTTCIFLLLIWFFKTSQNVQFIQKFTRA